MDQVKVGNFIKERRKEKGITQEQLAEILNVSSKSVSRWENGRNMPDYSILEQLCSVLDVSLNELLSGTIIEKDDIIKKYEKNLAEVLREYSKMKKQRDVLKCITLCIGVAVFILAFRLLVGFGLLKLVELSYLSSEVEVTTDTDMYLQVMGSNADEEYTFKNGDHEKIFPSTIDDLNVTDFQMVYYNPWDPQYLVTLEVKYEEAAYEAELERLEQYGVEEYVGEYGTTGFSEYEVQALDIIDQHYGMVYALRDDENQSIIYVELFFCNFFYDLEYWEYIDESLLPENFDATSDNVYMEPYLEDLKNQ